MGVGRLRSFSFAVAVAVTAGLTVAVPTVASAAVDRAAPVVINEVYGGGGNSGAPLRNDFVELINTGTTPVDLSSYSVQYAAAAGTNWSGVIALTGSVQPGQTYLVQAGSGGSAGAALPTPNATGTTNFAAANGNVALVSRATALTCTTSACASDPAVVDLVGFGTGQAFAGTAAAPAGTNTTSIARTKAANTADNRADFTAGAPSPAAGTAAPPPAGGAKTIAEIQGTGDASPLVGATVTTTGVVTAAYPDGGLRGFTIQTGGTGAARTTATGSDAVFVFADADPVSVSVGQSVSVTGVVSEFNGLTEITARATDVTELAQPLLPVTPVTTTWPRTEPEREKLESMLLQPGGAYTVTDTFATNRFGEVALATGTTPLVQPTDAAPAGSAEAAAVAADNAARAVTLDDGASINFLTPANQTLTPPYLSLTEPVRVGAGVSFPRPVIVDYRFNTWRLQPTTQVTNVSAPTERASFANTRTTAPEPVGGDVSVASFNVLNYFTTIGAQLSNCTSFNDRIGDPVTVNSCPNNGPRGAWDPADLQRQQDKIVTAINTTDASVTGLMEIENSVVLGEATDEATATLVAALNTAAGATKWAFVPSSTELPAASEMDVITNAIIYQPAKVSRTGESRALGTASSAGQAFDNAREPLGQAFTPISGGAPFFVVVNHFKSKGSGVDDGTGQGNANPDRVRQATALRDWVPTVQPAGVQDTFLLGDFNSYAQEDPLQTLYAAGYTNVNQTKEYSYSFAGKSGSLDHVLANGSALQRVTGSDIWNINSPESVALEYSRFNYTPTNFYASGPFRASDHDPVKVGFAAAAPAAATVDINLLNINDFHGRIDANTVKFAGTIEGLRAQGGEANTLLLAAGDSIGASLFASSSQQDQPSIDVLNALGLAASAVGNHELDQGLSDLTGRVSTASRWPYLAANMYRKGTTTPVVREYTTFTVGGVTVGVVGALTRETGSLVNPAGIATVEFGDPVDAVNRVAAQLSDGDPANGEADVIVAEFHEGANAGTSERATIDSEIAGGGVFAKIATQTSAQVDAIFTGHTHKEYVFEGPIPGSPGKTRPILQTGSYGDRIGQVVLSVDAASKGVLRHTARNVARVKSDDTTLVAQYPRVAQVKAITDAALARAQVVGGMPAATISADITRAFSDGGYTGPAGTYVGGSTEDRAKGSTVGTLVADALRDAKVPTGERIDLGITNPGGLRADLLFAGEPGSPTNTDGVVTVAEAVAVLPFANSLFLTTFTGDQLKAVLEQQWQRNSAGQVPSRAYLQLGLSDNVNYTFDPALPEGSRITSITVNGMAVTPTSTYRVSTLSFLAQGGDNFRGFLAGTNTTDTGLTDSDVLIAALKARSPAAPDFTKRSALLTGLSPAEAAPKAGDRVSVTVSDLDLTSLGSPRNTTVQASIGSGGVAAAAVGTSLGSVAVSGGAAEVSVVIPAGLSGRQTLTLTAQPSGTVVSVPLVVTAAAAGAGGGGGGLIDPTVPAGAVPAGVGAGVGPGGGAGTGGGLAFTGVQLEWALGLGTILVVLGGLMLLARRRTS